MSKVVIEALYPDFSNLYGDRGNLLYLRRKLELAGAEVELLETSLFETPAFAARDDVGFLYLGPCTERQQELELKALRPYREALLSRMDGAAVTLATGNAFELFGEKILRADPQKSEIKALGFWNTYAERFSRLRYNELCVGECGDISVTGFKNQLSHSYGETPAPFLKMHTGTGLNPQSRLEGARVGNFYATYLLGPLLALNPPFASRLLAEIYPGAEKVELPFEREAYEKRLAELSDPAVNHPKHHA